MAKETQSITSQIGAIVLVGSVFSLLIGSIVARIFFWDETYGYLNKLTNEYPLFLYPIFMVVCAYLVFSFFRDIEKGEAKSGFDVFRIIACAFGAIYCAVNFTLKLLEKF
ncbi:MAG: hypothetical protein P8X96_24270 [Desulfobacteraceae bacterium]